MSHGLKEEDCVLTPKIGGRDCVEESKRLNGNKIHCSNLNSGLNKISDSNRNLEKLLPHQKAEVLLSNLQFKGFDKFENSSLCSKSGSTPGF